MAVTDLGAKTLKDEFVLSCFLVNYFHQTSLLILWCWDLEVRETARPTWPFSASLSRDLQLKGSMLAVAAPSVGPVGLLRLAKPPNWDAQPLPSWLGFLCQEKKDVDFSSAVAGWAHSFPLNGRVKIRRKESFLPKSSDSCFLLLFTLDAFKGFVLGGFLFLFCSVCSVLFCLLRQGKKYLW